MRRSVACVWPALTHTLSLSPDYALLERLFERPEFLQCPRPLLALSVTPSRARASAPGLGLRCP